MKTKTKIVALIGLIGSLASIFSVVQSGFITINTGHNETSLKQKEILELNPLMELLKNDNPMKSLGLESIRSLNIDNLISTFKKRQFDVEDDKKYVKDGSTFILIHDAERWEVMPDQLPEDKTNPKEPIHIVILTDEYIQASRIINKTINSPYISTEIKESIKKFQEYRNNYPLSLGEVLNQAYTQMYDKYLDINSLNKDALLIKNNIRFHSINVESNKLRRKIYDFLKK